MKTKAFKILLTSFLIGIQLNYAQQVGIGIANPIGRLHVSGAIMADSLFIFTTNNMNLGKANINVNTALTNNNMLLLGISSSSPYKAPYIAYQLHSDALDIVGQGINSLKPRQIQFYANGGTQFTGNVNVLANTTIASINGTENLCLSNLIVSDIDLGTKVNIGNNNNNRMISILPNGNVGLDTDSALYKFDINGALITLSDLYINRLHISNDNLQPGYNAQVDNFIKIEDARTELEFGRSLSKYSFAGKWTSFCQPNSDLDIYGAGTNIENLKIKFWAENKTEITGNLSVTSLNTNSLEVSDTVSNNVLIGINGNTVSNINGGSVVVGAGNINSLLKTGTITFTTPFVTLPKVMMTVRNSGNFTDQFVISSFNLTTSSVQYTIKRIGTAAPPLGQPGWSQSLLLDWWIIQ